MSAAYALHISYYKTITNLTHEILVKWPAIKQLRYCVSVLYVMAFLRVCLEKSRFIRTCSYYFKNVFLDDAMLLFSEPEIIYLFKVYVCDKISALFSAEM